MGRRFQLWQKKRGHRRTGSRLEGSVGEGVLFAVLLLAGSFTLIALVTSRMIAIPGLSSLTSGSGLWLSVLVLTSMVLMGAGGLWWTLFHAGTSEERREAIANQAANLELLAAGFPSAGDFPTIPRNEYLADSPGTHLRYRLPGSSQPGWQLLALGLFCLMWNGLLASFAVLMAEGFVAGQPNWLLLLLLIPGLGVALQATRRFLAGVGTTLRIGSISVEVSDLPLYPGQRYDVGVVRTGGELSGPLKVLLACDESATFCEGTDIRIEQRRVFLHKVLQFSAGGTAPGMPFVHLGEIVVPREIMHSFKSHHNAIEWKLVVEGALQPGGDFERVFPLVVYPTNISHEQF